MIKIRFGVVGDTHGDEKDITNVLNEMGKRKITHLFVVGDFGLWTHFADGHAFLDTVNQVAEANGLSVFAVGGNHENWDHWEWFCKNMPTSKGFAMVRRRVLLAPKVHEFRLANLQFVVAGGAVSIDKESRLESERPQRDAMGRVYKSGTGPRTLWWPNEQLTEEDVKKIKQMTFANPYVDILLTHDCSNYTPFYSRIKPDPESQMHRQRIDEVIKAVKPKFHFHGHMHNKFEWDNTQSHGFIPSAFDFEVDAKWNGPVTKTYGLEANPNAMWGGDSNSDWWGVFDTELMQFAFQGEGMQFRSLES